MPWLWRPLWGPVWIDDNRTEKERGCPEAKIDRTQKTAGEEEGEQQVNDREGIKKRDKYPGRSVIYNPYQAFQKKTAEKQDNAVETRPPGAAGEEEEHKSSETGSNESALDNAVNKQGDELTGQMFNSISRQFDEVAPGVFQFKRNITPPGGGPPARPAPPQPARVDAAWFNSALPSAIEGYRKIGQTRDGLPVYSFK